MCAGPRRARLPKRGKSARDALAARRRQHRKARLPPNAQKARRGRSPPAGLLGARVRAAPRAHAPEAADAGPSGAGARSAHIEKRPPRARRPALPQPRAAVLSAKAGLTAGFGMGPGDPRLCGRARGGRSPAALSMEPARNPCPGRPWRPHGGHGSKMTHRARCFNRGCEELGLLVPLG